MSILCHPYSIFGPNPSDCPPSHQWEILLPHPNMLLLHHLTHSPKILLTMRAMSSGRPSVTLQAGFQSPGRCLLDLLWRDLSPIQLSILVSLTNSAHFSKKVLCNSLPAELLAVSHRQDFTFQSRDLDQQCFSQQSPQWRKKGCVNLFNTWWNDLPSTSPSKGPSAPPNTNSLYL